MNIQITSRDLWVTGTIEGYNWEAKVYDEPSKFGIDGGRVSKLTIWNENIRKKRNLSRASIASYDRGWDINPKNQRIYLALIDFLENLSSMDKPVSQTF